MVQLNCVSCKTNVHLFIHQWMVKVTHSSTTPFWVATHQLRNTVFKCCTYSSIHRILLCSPHRCSRWRSPSCRGESPQRPHTPCCSSSCCCSPSSLLLYTSSCRVMDRTDQRFSLDDLKLFLLDSQKVVLWCPSGLQRPLQVGEQLCF